MLFGVPWVRWLECPRVTGGGGAYFRLKVAYAAFRYMPHSAVVIRSESACALTTREKGEDESDPPQNRGVM